jgi:hypothetical protein
MERDLFIRQMKHPDEDYCYPIPKEAGNLWNAPSDGGSHWNYYNFEHYYFEETQSRFCWWGLKRDIPTREEAWKTWIKVFVGK